MSETFVVYNNARDIANFPLAGGGVLTIPPGGPTEVDRAEIKSATDLTEGNPDGFRARLERGEIEVHKPTYALGKKGEGG